MRATSRQISFADWELMRQRDQGIRLESLLEAISGFLDNQQDHQTANRLWASACREWPCMVLGSEIWSLHVAPNAYFEISDTLAAKLLAIAEFTSKLATVDYGRLADGLARVRGFQCPGVERRTGAAEAFFTAPNVDYCDLVSNFFRSS